MKKNKKLLTALGSLTLCAALCMGVAGCSNTGKKDADNKTATTTANDVYATSAVSSAAYLNTLGGAGSVNGSFNADGNTDRLSLPEYDRNQKQYRHVRKTRFEQYQRKNRSKRR